MSQHYDFAIIGSGAVGSAALYHASTLGQKVIGFDSLVPPHQHGSSHGESRIIRRAIGENPIYSKLSTKSYEIWGDLEKISNQKLIHKNGCLILVPNNESDPFFDKTIIAAQKYGIPCQEMNCKEVHEKYPEFTRISNIRACFEPSGGFVNPELIIATQLKTAQDNGASFLTNTKISNIEELNGQIRITTKENELFTAAKLVLATGPWIPKLLPAGLRDLFKVYRQVLYWFEFTNPQHFDVDKFPVFILHLHGGLGGIYGFPALYGPKTGIKLATHNVHQPADQEEISRLVTPDEIMYFFNTYIKPSFGNLIKPICIKTAVCSYTMTPDEGFIIDFIPKSTNMLFVSACSGHGFKHSAAVGEFAVNMLTKQKTICDPSLFSYKRFLNST